MKQFLIVLALCLAFHIDTDAQTIKTKNVFFITFDGLRWQEVFGGIDSAVMTSKSQIEDLKYFKTKYWDADVKQRQKKLMPFLWSEIASKGILVGNRTKNCKMNLTNKYWFSYPGYSELITGFADDSVKSNDKKNNPNISVFEAANQSKNYQNKVAAYASWDCFPYIFNKDRCGFEVNAGNRHATGAANCREQTLNDLVDNMAEFSEGIRYDIFTYNYALEYLKKNHPRLFFLGFDETDDNAHLGMYTRYLDAAQQSDRMVSQLWKWIQSEPEYKDQTTLIITCDHGRGGSENDQWKHHGANIKGADQTWMAIIGPDTPAKGEITNEQYYSNQIAQTIAYLLKVKFDAPKSGKAMLPLIGRNY